MNLKMVFNTLGNIMKTEALLLLVPLSVALMYGEKLSVMAFAVTIAIALFVGFAMTLFTKSANRIIYAKEGFAIVALAWVFMSAVGAIPFVINGDIPFYIDAFFETVSGFTTTGASIIPNVELLSKSSLIWRSFAHWVGGMGVLVFVMAFLPSISDRSIHIMRAEMPGPVVGKLVPRARDTAKILYLIYIVMTLVEVVLLSLGEMDLFESFLHAFGSAGTGGFGMKADSLASYSPYSQWIIGIFIMIFGVNFNLYYLILIRRAKVAFKSTELWAYVGVVAASVLLICANLGSLYETFSETVRHAFFQVTSIISTTGYTTVDFNLWPGFSKAILLMLMFMGGCAGSTAGGLKVSRVLLIFKVIGREIKQSLHPRSVNTVRLEGKTVEEKTAIGVCVYFAVYMLCVLVTFIILTLDPVAAGFETNFTASVTCFNNVGPGFAKVGPMGGFSFYSPFSKVILSFAMLFGRLEIYPILLAFFPATWTKRCK
ncbi:MAG: TrkH family potassium uptake protein [Ruminococcaceae bacterium]|nr:TrkH family potassium uptake protein [Oscillospiraceae bacterium]